MVLGFVNIPLRVVQIQHPRHDPTLISVCAAVLGLIRRRPMGVQHSISDRVLTAVILFTVCYCGGIVLMVLN